MRVSIKELIVVHVCYRDIFNAPVSIDALKIWMGIRNDNLPIFDTALEELKSEGLIIESMGYVAYITKEEIIQDQWKKNELTKQIIAKGQRGLTILSKIPFIKFVGISGSVAAKNPTNNSIENHVDLDLYIVTAKNTVWCFLLLERIFAFLVKVFRSNHFYCCNYVTDESFLEIYNKNFYTATELVNMKPIINKGVFSKLIAINRWIEKYYDMECIKGVHTEIPRTSFNSRILVFVNYVCFMLFGILRSIKKLDLAGIKELKTSFDPNITFNMLRRSAANGGYQELIKKRFEELLQLNFKNYFSEKLIEDFFPNKDAFVFSPYSRIEDFNLEQDFRKYTLQAHEKSSI